MKSEIKKQAPRARCAQCGDTAVVAVCAKCSSPLCSLHSQHVRRYAFALQDFARQPRRHLVLVACRHNPTCGLHRPGPEVTWPRIGLLLCGLSGLLTLVNAHPTFGLGAFALGVTLFVRASWENLQRLARVRRERPPLSIAVEFKDVSIREAVRSRITLDREGKYRSTIDAIGGELRVESHLGPRERAAARGYCRALSVQPQTLMAGFLVFNGALDLRFFGVGNSPDRAPPSEPLKLCDACPASLLNHTHDATEELQWRFERNYVVLREVNEKNFPLRLIASFGQANRKLLLLDLQWNLKKQPDEPQLLPTKVEKLRLNFPSSWEKVVKWWGGEDRSTAFESFQPQRGEFVISHVPLNIDEKNPGSTRFIFEFAKPLSEASVLQGELEVRFDGSLSGVNRIKHFAAAGIAQSLPKSTVRTIAHVDFDIALDSRRWQEVRAFPTPEDQGEWEYRDLQVDQETALALAESLSKHFFIKSLMETSSRIDQELTRVAKRWDISGRSYDGAHPVDFRVVLQGTFDPARPAAPKEAKVSLSVQGVYANQVMNDRVVDVWGDLRRFIVRALQPFGTQCSSDAAATKGRNSLPTRIPPPLPPT